MISRKKILLFTIIELLFFLKISNVFAISRNAVMDNAEVYKNFIWNCSSNNVYDVYLNTSIPAGIIFNPNNPPDGAVEGKDYIDDRMGNIRDVNNDGIIDTKDITSTNLSNWPYYINTTTAPFVGEAYAWGYGHHLTNAHKPNITPYNYKSFEEYLSEGRISGARKGDPSNDYGTDTRFTGLDCSGFVTRCWNIPRYHQGTGQLSEWSKNIDINDLKSGDILNKVGLHTIIFKDWIEKPAKAKIIHATADRFKYNEHIRRVIEDEVMISQIADYIPYSPFPIFSNITPSSSTIMNIITPTIQITIQSGPQTGDNFNKVISTSVYIIIDKDTENERIVPNTALTKTPTTNSKSLVITYNVPEANPLSEGEHTIYVYAQNELNLEDDNTDKLHLFTIDTTPPIKVTPPLQQISSGLIKPYKIEIKNKYENAEIHSIEIVGDGTPGWTIGALNPNTPSINIPAGTTNTMTFNVTNNSAVSNMIIKVKVTAKGETKTVECIASVSGERVNDNPDDTYSVSSPQYPGTWLYDSESEIGILSNGWGIGLGYLLGNKGIATCVVKDDLTILNEPGRSINDLKVLLIGSAGLMGLDSSATFKQKLAEYLHYIFNGYLKKTIILSRDI